MKQIELICENDIVFAERYNKIIEFNRQKDKELMSFCDVNDIKYAYCCSMVLEGNNDLLKRKLFKLFMDYNLSQKLKYFKEMGGVINYGFEEYLVKCK